LIEGDNEFAFVKPQAALPRPLTASLPGLVRGRPILTFDLADLVLAAVAEVALRAFPV